MEHHINVRVVELSRLAGVTKSSVSEAVRGKAKDELEMNGSRIIGITPEGVQRYMLQRGYDRLYRSALLVFSTQTGGAGKTSSCLNSAIAARRVTDRKHAIVLIDCDSQASLSLQAAGSPAPDDTPVLVD